MIVGLGNSNFYLASTFNYFGDGRKLNGLASADGKNRTRIVAVVAGIVGKIDKSKAYTNNLVVISITNVIVGDGKRNRERIADNNRVGQLINSNFGGRKSRRRKEKEKKD